MAIERLFEKYDGDITFYCDDCQDDFDTNSSDFNAALASMKDEGWRCVKTSSGWEHYCNECKNQLENL